jgi:hypothetical protein
VAAVHAAAVARDLDADGPLYLLVAAAHHGLALFEPARTTVHLLQQSLSCLAFRSGVTDLPTLARLFTLGVQGWPVLLTGACWFLLPRRDRGWILGPLLNLAVVIPTVSFAGIHEAIIASCVLWLVFFALEFDAGGWLGPIAGVALAAAAFDLYEATFPFMLGLALLAWQRARQAEGMRRVLLALVVPLALVAASHALLWTVRPRDPVNRGDLLHGLLGGFLVTGEAGTRELHLPALVALATAACLVSAWAAAGRGGERGTRIVRAACGASLLLCALVAALFVAIPERVTTIEAFSASRGLPIVATTAMAAAVHLLRSAGWTPERLAPAPLRVLLAGVIAMQLVVQTSLSVEWAAYRTDLATLVATRRGPIAWPDAAAALNPGHEALRGSLVGSWDIQALSIALAPRGRVQAVVDARPGVRWKPYRLDDPARLPLAVRGLDWSSYLESIGRGERSAPAPSR